MKIITIDREFGAGGHSVGREVARRLGIEIYDKDIIRGAAKTSGISQDEVESQEESLSRGDSFVSAIMPMSFELKDAVFDAERQAILDLASKGACVMLGRCASAILAEEGFDVISVFLHQEKQPRLAHVGEVIGLTDEADILRAMKKMDEKRKAYYEHYTGRRWGDCRDYTLCFDVGAVGYDLCIETICAVAKEA